MAALVIAQPLAVADTLSAKAGLVTGGTLRPSLATTVNDWQPSGSVAGSRCIVNAIAVATTSASAVTGLSLAQVDGQLVYVSNTGASALTLVASSTGSTAANRLALPANITLAQNQGIWLRYDSTAARWFAIGAVSDPGHGPIYKSTTTVDAVNTTTKTTIVSFTVPGGTLGTDDALEIDVAGDYLNGSAGTSTLAIEVAYGGTVLYADTTTAQTAAASNRHPINLYLVLAGAGSTSAQVLTGAIAMGKAGATTTGLGDIAALITTATGFSSPVYGSAAVDSTADRTLTISVTHGSANANISCRALYVNAHTVGNGAKGATGAPGPPGYLGPIGYSGLGYPLSSSDNGYDIYCDNTSSIAINISPQSSAPVPAGFACQFSQKGTGVVTATAGSGVTLKAPYGAATAAVEDARTLQYLGSDVWRVL